MAAGAAGSSSPNERTYLIEFAASALLAPLGAELVFRRLRSPEANSSARQSERAKSVARPLAAIELAGGGRT